MKIFIFFFSFLLATTQDRGANLHQTFLEVGKWTAIEKLSFWFKLCRWWQRRQAGANW